MSHNRREGWWERPPCTPWASWTARWIRTRVFRRPRAWLALQIRALIFVETPVTADHAADVFEVVDSLQLGAISWDSRYSVDNWAGAGWNRTSVLPRLMVRLNRREASANLLTTTWRSDSLCAMRTQSSANGASSTVFLTVFVLVVSRWRSNRELSSRYRRYTPCSRSLTAWFNTQVKNRLKRTGASTHPCSTPLELLKGSNASPSESTCPVMSSWNTGESGSRTLSGTPAWTESPKGPLCWPCQRLLSGLWRRQQGPYSVRCTSPAPVVQRRSCRWCCSLGGIVSYVSLVTDAGCILVCEIWKAFPICLFFL